MKVLNIKINEKSTGVFVVDLAGPLDTYTHETFDYQMEAVLKTSTKAIILNMTGVDYVSSMGVGSIFKVRKYAKDHNIDVGVANVQPSVKKVFDAVQAMPKEAIFTSLAEIDAYLDEIQRKGDK